jgi:hypothetical protein
LRYQDLWLSVWCLASDSDSDSDIESVDVR